MEPYLAYRAGMSLNRIAQTYGIANIRLLLDTMEHGLDQLNPYFDRDEFLAKARTALEIRRRDSGVGAERAAAAKKASTTPPEEESTQKRGAEWATIESTQPVRPQRRRALKPDLPWSGMPAKPYQRGVWTAAANARHEMADPMLPMTIEIQPSRKEQRKRQLEQGLRVILDTMPPGVRSR